jgi:hypothetical protein
VYANLCKVKACIARHIIGVLVPNIAKEVQRCNSIGAQLAHKYLVLRIECKEIYIVKRRRARKTQQEIVGK